MSKTTITHPDGTRTIVKTKGGFSSGCSYIVTLYALAFVIVAPGHYLSLWLAIPIYILLGFAGLCIVVNIVSKLRGHNG